MNEPLKLILTLSLAGSLLAGLLFMMKPLAGSRISKSIQYYTWIIVLLRLLLPLSFNGSMMGTVFYGSSIPPAAVNTAEVKTGGFEAVNDSPSRVDVGRQPVIQGAGNAANGWIYSRDFWNTAVLSIWLLGAVLVFMKKMRGYIRFKALIQKTNRPAATDEKQMLQVLLRGYGKVGLFRNSYITTPMLVGVTRPAIIIPDTAMNEKELRHILLHEITHLKGKDIPIKWLTMAVVSLHWFNPLMGPIQKEINRLCELSCDERVIKNLTASEKKDYGYTLMAVAAVHRYPAGVLQATMCEEKTSLKERLRAIMKDNSRSRFAVFASILFVMAIISGAVLFGPGAAKSHEKTEPDGVMMDTAYDIEDIYRYRTPYVGDNSKVSAIVNRLPVPDSYFKQRYISLSTNEKPYGLTVYHEPAIYKDFHTEGWLAASQKPALETNLWRNSLVLFCMIENVEEVTFAFRLSPSEGGLDITQYETFFTLTRTEIEQKYGDLSVLAESPSMLQDRLTEKLRTFKGLELYVWRKPALTGSEDLFYTLLPGTNMSKTESQVYNLVTGTSNLESVMQELSNYESGTYLFVHHTRDIDQRTMTEIGDTLSDVMENGVISISAYEFQQNEDAHE